MTRKKEAPLVSVLLPCYNAEEYVEQAVESIINQTYNKIEIICIDDGSQDATFEILEALSGIDNRIRIYRNNINIGIIDTLNRAIDLANGEFIARMDADDISLPDRIERLLCFLKHSASDLVSCDFRRIVDGRIKRSSGLKAYSYAEVVIGSFLFNPINHPALLCKSRVLKDSKYLKSDKTVHCEDYELWNRLIDEGNKVANYEYVLYEYRENNKGVSHLYSEIQVYNFIILVRDRLANQLNITVDQEVLECAVNRLSTPSKSILSSATQLIDRITHLIEDRYHLQPGSGKVVINKHKIDIYLSAILKSTSNRLRCYFATKVLILMACNMNVASYGFKRILGHFNW